MNINDLDFDSQHIWHPYTSITNPIPVYPVISASGFYLTLSNGKKLVDGMSSWWAAIHGYNNPEINEAMKKQIDIMSHVMFGGITHLPAINLCRKLVSLLPELECVFLADSGSVAVEIAIKMAIQYWYALGKRKTKLLAFKKGYHGDTLGAMSVCDPENSMHNIYGSYIPLHKFVNIPLKKFGEIWNNQDDEFLIETFDTYHNQLAAIILEPIVQGAGGMYFYHPKYLNSIRKLCNKYNILLIADEIATGFGRTGELFACNHAKIMPDIMCIGKALTGGMMTLSAVLTKRNVAEIVSNSDVGCFMHGPTFMANPLACSAANASLCLLENKIWKDQVKNISKCLESGLRPLENHPNVKEVRVLGAIGVVETFRPVSVEKLQRWFVNYGVWIRPFKKLIYLMPPYIISNDALFLLIEAITKSVNYSEHFLY